VWKPSERRSLFRPLTDRAALPCYLSGTLLRIRWGEVPLTVLVIDDLGPFFESSHGHEQTLIRKK
jgi:hypothetical protein